MKQTIYYLSDIKWFGKITSDKYNSKKDMVRAHVEYIENSKDFVFSTENKKEILDRIDLADKRVNSRVAFSFVFAIPNDLEDLEVQKWIEDIRQIIAENFNMSENDIFIGFHRSEGLSKLGNNHLHVAGVNLQRNNKSLKINRKELQNLHNSLRQYINEQGYEIKKDEEQSEHIGTRLKYDDELREDYIESVKAKREIERIENELAQRKLNKLTDKFSEPKTKTHSPPFSPSPSGRKQKKLLLTGNVERAKEYLKAIGKENEYEVVKLPDLVEMFTNDEEKFYNFLSELSRQDFEIYLDRESERYYREQIEVMLLSVLNRKVKIHTQSDYEEKKWKEKLEEFYSQEQNPYRRKGPSL